MRECHPDCQLPPSGGPATLADLAAWQPTTSLWLGEPEGHQKYFLWEIGDEIAGWVDAAHGGDTFIGPAPAILARAAVAGCTIVHAHHTPRPGVAYQGREYCEHYFRLVLPDA